MRYAYKGRLNFENRMNTPRGIKNIAIVITTKSKRKDMNC